MAPRVFAFRRFATAGVLAVSVGLTACSSVARPTPSATPATSGPSGDTVTTAPILPIATDVGPVRCALTPGATASATIVVLQDKLGFFDFSDPVTIATGQAVVFPNGNGALHTVTEGTYGEAAPGACVDANQPTHSSVTVTFYVPGEYQITCRFHRSMETAVIVHA